MMFASKGKRDLVLGVLAALDERGVTYCLRRELAPLDSCEHLLEIDLLVLPQDLPAVSHVLAERNFAVVPSWGYAPHHFFFAYLEAEDAWVKFDVVTDLRYGEPLRALRAGIFPDCLKRRRRCGPAYVFSPEDEFLTVLLSCVVHKRRFDTQSRACLARLRGEFAASSDSERRLREILDACLAPALPWPDLSRALEREDWEFLLSRRRAILRQLFWREPLRSLERMVWGLALRRLRPLLFALRCRGLTVALLAPDGAGKTTLARQLAAEEAFRAKMIYMGENLEARTTALPTTRWLTRKVLSLNGDRKSLRGLMWRGLNFASRLADHWLRSGAAQFHRLRGRFVIFDRYPYDSLLQKPDPRLWKRLRRWLFDVVNAEPDLVLLLDAPPDLLQRRKREHSLEWHVEQRAGYLRLRERLARLHVVDAARAQAEVRRTATSLIWNHYRTRSRETHEAGH